MKNSLISIAAAALSFIVASCGGDKHEGTLYKPTNSSEVAFQQSVVKTSFDSAQTTSELDVILVRGNADNEFETEIVFKPVEKEPNYGTLFTHPKKAVFEQGSYTTKVQVKFDPTKLEVGKNYQLGYSLPDNAPNSIVGSQLQTTASILRVYAWEDAKKEATINDEWVFEALLEIDNPAKRDLWKAVGFDNVFFVKDYYSKGKGLQFAVNGSKVTIVNGDLNKADGLYWVSTGTEIGSYGVASVAINADESSYDAATKTVTLAQKLAVKAGSWAPYEATITWE